MSEIQLPKGITLGELARRKSEFDLKALLGETRVLVFRHSDEGSPLYATPEEGIPSGHLASETSVFSFKDGEAPNAGHLGNAVVVPLTPTHKNLHEDQVLMGRALTNDIRLVSNQISKVHVRFELDEGKWQIVDLGSSNGTRLNGLKLEADRGYFMRDGDELIVGDIVVLYLDAEGLLDLTSLVPPA